MNKEIERAFERRPPQDRVAALIHDHVNGMLNEVTALELESLLERFPELTDDCCDQHMIEGLIRAKACAYQDCIPCPSFAFDEPVSPGNALTIRSPEVCLATASSATGIPSLSRYLITVILILAFSSIGGGFLFFHFLPRGSNTQAPPLIAARPDPVEKTETYDAQIVRTNSVFWEKTEDYFFEWESVKVGRTLKFLQGSIEIVFPKGVHVILEGPAELTVVEPQMVEVKQGRIMARVGKDGAGFTVDTPTGRIVDRGTEFGVDIRPEKGIDVVVYRGKVDVFPENSSSIEKLSVFQGEGIVIDAAGTISPVKMVEAGYFLSSAQPRSVRHKIIASVNDNVRESMALKFYEIVYGGFHEDAVAYLDRCHEWNGIDENGLPVELLGGDYIRSFNDDKFNPDYRLTVELAVPATLYIFLDQRSEIPKWLEDDFIKTDLVVGLDEGWKPQSPEQLQEVFGFFNIKTPKYQKKFLESSNFYCAIGPGQSVDSQFHVWKKVIPEPGTITLGSVVNIGMHNQYGIVAVALTP